MYYILRYYIKECDGVFNPNFRVFNNYISEADYPKEFLTLEEAQDYFNALKCEILEIEGEQSYYGKKRENYKLKVFHTIEERPVFLTVGQEMACNLI